MSDCAYSTAALARKRLRLVLLSAAWITSVASCGCVFGPHGRPIGAGACDALGHLVDHGVPCGNCNCHQCQHGACCDTCLAAPACSCNQQCNVEDGTWFADEAGCGVPCSSACNDGSCTGAGCVHPMCPRFLTCDWYEPEAGIFNFCMPPASIGAPPPPPPGRFFPVPTRPAFAPRNATVVAEPSGW